MSKQDWRKIAANSIGLQTLTNRGFLIYGPRGDLPFGWVKYRVNGTPRIGKPRDRSS